MRIKPRYPEFPEEKNFRILVPGHYALEHDEIQRQFWGAGHTGPNGGSIVNIYCGSVELDLSGFTIGADFGVGGIELSAIRNLRNASEFPTSYGPASLDSRFVSLYNGTVDMARGKRTHTAVEFVNVWNDAYKLMLKRPDLTPFAKEMSTERVEYTRNEYRFEKLKLLSNVISLVAEGSYTTIRDCIIECGGDAAIFIAGPNVTIENCEIRLRKLNPDYLYRQSKARAAIILRDGSNAIIRNNRIRVDYGDMQTEDHCILVRDGAKNVLIENNTFINVRGDPVTLTEGSEAIVLNNKSIETFLPF